MSFDSPRHLLPIVVMFHGHCFNFNRIGIKNIIAMVAKVIMDTARTENGYSCSCSLIPGWVVAKSGDFDEFKDYVQESVNFYLDCAREDGEKYDAVFDGEYELVYKFDVQSLLEYYRGIFSFSALQTITGINQKQLCHYASGVSKPRPAQAKKIADGLHRLAKELASVTV